MSRYIKDSKAKESLYAMFGITSSAAVTAIDIAIDKTPTADVQEVRHGKWINDKEDVYWGNHIVKKHCSECGYTPRFNKETELFDLSKYCPECGAKMDGE